MSDPITQPDQESQTPHAQDTQTPTPTQEESQNIQDSPAQDTDQSESEQEDANQESENLENADGGMGDTEGDESAPAQESQESQENDGAQDSQESENPQSADKSLTTFIQKLYIEIPHITPILGKVDIQAYKIPLESFLLTASWEHLFSDIESLLQASDEKHLEQNFQAFALKYPSLSTMLEQCASHPSFESDVRKLIEETLKLNPPNITITPHPYPVDEDRLQELSTLDEKLQQALEDNTTFKEHTRLNLQALRELYKMSLDIYEFYEYQISQLTISNQDYQNLRAQLSVIASYINTTLTDIDTTYKSALGIFQKSETLLDEARREADSIAGDVESVKQTYSLMQDLQSLLPNMQDLHAKIQAIITQASTIRDEINNLAPQILSDMRTTLLSDKESYERELEAKKSEYIALFDEKIAYLNQKLSEFETNWQTYNAKIEECYNRIESFLTDLTTKREEIATTHTQNLAQLESTHTQKLEAYNQNATEKTNALSTQFEGHKSDLESFSQTKLQEIQTKVTEHTNTLEAKKNEHISTLETKTTEHTNTLEAKKNEHISTLETKTTEHTNTLNIHKENLKNELSTHEQGLANTMTSIKNSYLTEIRNDIPAQVATLTQLCNEIKASNQALGTNYVSKTYTAGGTFSVVSGVNSYYVFVRGGTGGSNSSTKGGTTSFGSLLSATGGAGNPNGAGQLGESRAGFVTFTNNQSMTIPSGGVIIVSYATR